MNEKDKADAAYTELEQAARVFQDAILKFRSQFETNTVCLELWRQEIDDTLFEISEDITSYFEEE